MCAWCHRPPVEHWTNDTNPFHGGVESGEGRGRLLSVGLPLLTLYDPYLFILDAAEAQFAVNSVTPAVNRHTAASVLAV